MCILLINIITFDSNIKNIRTGKNMEEKEAITAFNDKGPVIVLLLNKKNYYLSNYQNNLSPIFYNII